MQRLKQFYSVFQFRIRDVRLKAHLLLQLVFSRVYRNISLHNQNMQWKQNTALIYETKWILVRILSFLFSPFNKPDFAYASLQGRREVNNVTFSGLWSIIYVRWSMHRLLVTCCKHFCRATSFNLNSYSSSRKKAMKIQGCILHWRELGDVRFNIALGLMNHSEMWKF